MGAAVAFSMAVGILTGAAGAYAVGRLLIKKMSSLSRRPKITRAGGLVGGLLVIFPAFFGAIVIGGNFGGSWGAVLGGEAVVPIGLAIGIAVVLSCGLTLGAVAGALLGTLLSISRAKGEP